MNGSRLSYDKCLVFVLVVRAIAELCGLSLERGKTLRLRSVSWRPQTSRDTFSSPEPTILLACGRNQELWEQHLRACAIDED